MGWNTDRETGLLGIASPFGQQAWLDLDNGYGVLLLLEASWANSYYLYGLLPEVVHEAVLTARG